MIRRLALYTFAAATGVACGLALTVRGAARLLATRDDIHDIFDTEED